VHDCRFARVTAADAERYRIRGVGRRVSIIGLAIYPLACGAAWSSRPPPGTGLRWTGDAEVAGNAGGAVVGGPALRFRYGMELRRPSSGGDGWSDALIGSWGGVELSGAVLTGAIERDRAGTLAIVGGRPWLSKRQIGRFLDSERISLLGAMIPDVGMAFGLGGGPRWHLSWQVPLGGDEFQIVPGLSWISPGGGQHFLGMLAFRVPM
jgi:hypothetical protein